MSAVLASGAATMDYRSPFPWFGGKSRAAPLVWSALGNVLNYVEPFFGAGAVYFLRPHPHRIATLNDKDGMVANFWRALRANPAAVAEWADQPVFENDLHARHYWLIQQLADLPARMEADPDWYDAKIAGWWVWGICCWIGSGFCVPKGPWTVVEGKLVKGNAGKGVNRQLPHLGDAGKGVNRKLPHLSNAGQGVNRQRQDLAAYCRELADRLRPARVCCGDWKRVVGYSPTCKLGMTGVFLDPPYKAENRNDSLYRCEAVDLPAEVEAWALEQGDHPLLRIVVAGYDGEYPRLEAAGWRVVPWKANGGYANSGQGNGKNNRFRERLWLSPHCLEKLQTALWESNCSPP